MDVVDSFICEWRFIKRSTLLTDQQRRKLAKRLLRTIEKYFSDKGLPIYSTWGWITFPSSLVQLDTLSLAILTTTFFILLLVALWRNRK